MSVAMMISNPVNDEEKIFYIPISTEKVFHDYWMPIIEELDLKRAKYFQIGIEIEKKDLKSVLKELAEIQAWIVKYMNSERGEDMIERLENLTKGLMKILNSSRSDIKVYIG